MAQRQPVHTGAPTARAARAADGGYRRPMAQGEGSVVDPDRPAGPRRDWRALGLAAGPVAFISAWVVGGGRMPGGYSPVHDAISRIAAVHAPQRASMTAGFLGYATAVGAGSMAVRRSPLAPAWPLVAVNAAATAAVAALPLDHSGAVDGLHAMAAAVGYVSISVAPLVAAGPLRHRGWRRAAAASSVIGLASGACLAATVVSDSSGLYQRLGLTLGDAWLAAVAAALLTGHLGASPPRPNT